MDKTRKISTFGAAAVLAIALGTGGYAFASGSTQAAADTYTAPISQSVAPTAQDDAAAQSIYDQQIAQAKAEAEAAAAAKAAADAAAAQAAADAAAKQTAVKSVTAPIKCPAGSTANSGDGGNDTSCFPDICFHITLPDPAHPECDTPFKP